MDDPKFLAESSPLVQAQQQAINVIQITTSSLIYSTQQKAQSTYFMTFF